MAKAKVDKSPVEVNKTQLVADAMDALGDPGPKEIIAHVKENHGIELPYAMAASYKSIIKKKRGLTSGRGGAVPSGSVDMKDLAAVKALVDRLGAAQLRNLINVLGQ